MKVIHKFFQAHSVFHVAVTVCRTRGKRNAETEQSGSQDAVDGVVF